MTFQKCRLLIFFKMTFLEKYKINQEYLSQDQTVYIQIESDVRDFIWPFVTPYMRVIPNPTIAFFPNFMYFSSYFPIFIIYFPKCEGKGSVPKSQINSLDVIVGPDLGLKCLRETSSLISIQNCFGGGSVFVDFFVYYYSHCGSL